MKNTFSTFCLLLFLFLIDASALSAAAAQAKIHMTNGEVIECFVEMPIKITSKRLKIRVSEDARSEWVVSDKIDIIFLTSRESTFVLTYTYANYQKRKGTYEKSNSKKWLKVNLFCTNVSSYLGMEEYGLNHHGFLVLKSGDGMGMQFVHQEGEEFPHRVGPIFIRGANAIRYNDKRKRYVLNYFKNDSKATEHFSKMDSISQHDLIEYLESICEK